MSKKIIILLITIIILFLGNNIMAVTDKVNDLTYNELLSMLQKKEVKTNNVDKKNEIFTRILKNIYENYDSHYYLYKNAKIPTRNEYIIEHFINVLDYISYIDLIDRNSDRAQDMIINGEQLAGFASTDEKGNIYIKYAYDSDLDIDAELVYHEITHVSQFVGSIIEKCYQYGEEVYEIFIEGDASFHQNFTRDLLVRNGGSWIVENDNEIAIIYTKNNCEGYLTNLNMYANLLLITNYNVMEDLRINGDYNAFKKYISDNYNEKISDEMFKSLKIIFDTEIDKNIKFDNCIKFENMILECLYYNLNNCNTKESVKDFADFYMLYRYYLLPRVFENSDIYNSEDITRNYLNIDKLENLLIEKMLEFKILKLDEYSTSEQKAILHAILYSSIKVYNVVNMPTYSLIELPKSINQIDIKSYNYKSGYTVDIGYSTRIENSYYQYVVMRYNLNNDYFVTSVNNIKFGYSSTSDLEENIKFNDVKLTSWYYNAVKYCYQNNIMTGTDENTFSPNAKLTRGMLASILYKMEGTPKVSGSMKFSDVAKGKYYYNAVLWASQKNVVNGSNGKFKPGDYVTRQDLAVMLKNYANYKKKYVSSNYGLTKFSDYKNVSSYALSAMRWAVKNNVINGSNGKLNPKGTATRAEAASMIYNYCKSFK